MANVKIGSVLNPVDWAKKAGPAEKQSGLTDPLKALYKQFDLMPLELLELTGLDTVQTAKDRSEDLEDGGKFGKAVKTLADLAKAVVVRAKKCEADFKKDDKAPKGAAAAAGAVAQAAEVLVRDVDDAWGKAQAGLKSLLPKLEAEEKKEQAEIDKAAAKKDDTKNAKKGKEEEDTDADDLANDKDEKKFRDKVKSTLVSWMKKVKAEGSPPAKFTVVVLGKTWGVYLAKAAGESEKKVAMRLAGLKSGFKHCKGEMYWDPKSRVWVFEGMNIPLGRANATSMSQALKPVIGYAPRLRLQKPGERGEDMEGGDPDPDDLPEAAGVVGGKAGPAGVDPVKAFTARLGALQPKIKSALAGGGSAVDQIKSAVAKAGDLATKGGVDAANKLLDQVEKQLGAARAAVGSAAGAPAAAPDPALAKLGQARSEWMAARAQAVRGIEQLAQRIEQEYRDEVGQRAQVQAATARLRALAGQLRADLETQLDAALKEKDTNRRAAMLRTAKVALAAVVKTVAQDPLMKELDGNELMPELQIVKPMQERLREIAAALG